ncbi:MAG: molybdate ABC transporter substrate-binding protein [Opitutaceae bacterium]
MRVLPVFVLFAAVLLAPALHAAELTVFAAASLAEALQELAPRYAAESGDTLRFNFGASGTLARQIREGAPADVLISADEFRLDQLERAGLLAAGTRRTILANQLVVIIGSEGEPLHALGALISANVRRIAIGEPDTVPAGNYAKQYLESAGLWPRLSGKLVPLDNVRAVLAAVEAGNADVGFVYRTDALLAKKARIAVALPIDAGPRITYPASVLRGAKSPAAAARFVAFLAGSEAQAVFARHGFLPAF